jgi:hypothetical protein
MLKMKNKISVFVLTILSLQAVAQSKIVPVTQSALTGISLPEGSKQDKRLLVTATAKTVLEMVAEDNSIALSENIEVLVLPPAAGNEITEKVKSNLTQEGWKLTGVPSQSSHWMLQKNETRVMMYLQSSKRDTQLYFSTINILANSPSSPNDRNEVKSEKEMVNTTQPAVNPLPPAVNKPEQKLPTSKSAFVFTTTNFDDGWVSTAREDWVEVVKGNCKVLIHYPNKATNEYISDPNAAREVAWNTLVAPRYQNLQNYFVGKNKLTYIEANFLSGTLTDNQTGNTFYVALFQRGNSPWIEFVAPTIEVFGNATGFDINKLADNVDSDSWDPLQKMAVYNKFAVAASDLGGIWTNNFGGFQQYVYVSTGANAGMATHSSTETFEFVGGNKYNWSLSTATGYVGSMDFRGSKSSGTATLPNNWQIQFSDIGGKPRLFNAYFSCLKGARLLWLQDTGYGGYTSYGKQ